ncbi:hypothetical protein AB0O57_32360 [Streptomyces sp. NPDC091201]|uniref:hypothetical protein n=1 Tax=Streptomyces sp. NPDC091201 TaxID=3155190 RepID=UPI0034404B10
MEEIPRGNFTIVNNETGRCVRVRLGKTTDVSDWKEGTRYVQTVTKKPTLELGEADGSPATAWWFSTIDDAVERQPFNQFVSYAVDEYQNIGRHCVWLFTAQHSDAEQKRRTRDQFTDRLDGLPEGLLKKLGELIPEEVTEIHLESREVRREAWMARAQAEERVGIECVLEALATGEDPLNTEKLERLRSILTMELQYRAYAQKDLPRDDPSEWNRLARETVLEKLSDDKEALALLQELDARSEKIGTRIAGLYPQVEERVMGDLEKQWQNRVPVQELELWHALCSHLEVRGERGLRHPKFREARFITAMRAYLDAAAKEGIRPTPAAASAGWTDMNGCGASRGRNSTYRWVYDGTHIYGADSRTVPQERTYWTDDNGYLVGKNKGGPGQTWTLAPWKPSAPKTGISAGGAILTGLFGPLAGFLVD